MTNRSHTPDWDQKDFVDWLKTQGLSSRAASDYASRCKRVERIFQISLNKELINVDKFTSLMVDIQKYAKETANTRNAAYNISGTLRLAVRKFALYLLGNKALSYPMNHSLGKKFNYTYIEAKI